VTTLNEHLSTWSGTDPARQSVADVVAAIATAAVQLASVVAQGPLAGDLGRILGVSNEGDGHKALDAYANTLFIDHLRATPVAAVVSEEVNEPVVLNPGGVLAVALDPLDGSNNIDLNAPLGTVFSVLPAKTPGAPQSSLFLIPGSHQLAAGFVLYGPHTSFALTLGDGVNIFTLDPKLGVFVLTHSRVQIPPGRREYAINSSNARHWPLPVRAFVEECVAGRDGPRGVDYNTRWLGAVVSEVFRILVHGGIYLYPGDVRAGYRRGRLRLLYEVSPIAFLIEQAGGTATDGYTRVLDIVPTQIHEQAPLIFGSTDKVDRVIDLYKESVPQAGQRPLFATRGLFKS
jgi:fructose-1,6-bisphosphatase I